jgi:hypothetical protein
LLSACTSPFIPYSSFLFNYSFILLSHPLFHQSFASSSYRFLHSLHPSIHWLLVRHSRSPQRRKINLLPSLNPLRPRQPSKLPLRHHRPRRSPCCRPRRSIHISLQSLQTAVENPCVFDGVWYRRLDKGS